METDIETKYEYIFFHQCQQIINVCMFVGSEK